MYITSTLIRNSEYVYLNFNFHKRIPSLDTRQELALLSSDWMFVLWVPAEVCRNPGQKFSLFPSVHAWDCRQVERFLVFQPVGNSLLRRGQFLPKPWFKRKMFTSFYDWLQNVNIFAITLFRWDTTNVFPGLVILSIKSGTLLLGLTLRCGLFFPVDLIFDFPNNRK